MKNKNCKNIVELRELEKIVVEIYRLQQLKPLLGQHLNDSPLTLSESRNRYEMQLNLEIERLKQLELDLMNKLLILDVDK